MPLPSAPAVDPAEYDAPRDRAERRRRRAVARTDRRSRWWWGPTATLITLLSLWGLLRTDQFLGNALVWPRQGARFVEISDRLPSGDSRAGGDAITVVVSGLNTKSGTAVASALLPALAAGGGRVFSLVYGSGISDDDLIVKYDSLIAEVRPRQVTFFGSSMGGDVALNLAAHAHHIRQDQIDRRVAEAIEAGRHRDGGRPTPFATAATRAAETSRAPGDLPDDRLPPRVQTVYLDSTPLGADDVRDRSRTSADVLTAVTEAVGTDGGAVTRVLVEVMVQRQQWSAGLLPTPVIRGDDLAFKYRQVLREKIAAPGISTALVKDQYGVIRRMDAAARLAELGEGVEPVRVVYFRPVDATGDTVVAVERVTQELGRLATDVDVEIRVVGVPDGHHAAAQSLPQAYLAAITAPDPGSRLSSEPGDVIILAADRP